MTDNIFAAVDNYISRRVAPEDAALLGVIQSLSDEGLPQHSISPTQGKLLQVMMAACSAKRVLELGTLGGYSTIWLARALPENGKVITIEADHHHSTVARQNIVNAGLAEKVEIRTGRGQDLLPQMIEHKEDPFDLIFIDADKPPYTEYHNYAIQLSRPGTIIICDNVIREGKVLDEDSKDEKVKGVQRLLDSLKDNNAVTATVLQTVGIKEHDGMVIAVVK